jgi:hypothetical protein
VGRTKRSWEYSIKMDLKVIGMDGIDWTHLAKDRGQRKALVNKKKNYLSSSANLLEIIE